MAREGVITSVACIIMIVGYIAVVWVLTPAWSDTGGVTWVGVKTYSAAGFDTPYAITTQNHGTLNFTTGQNSLGNVTLHQCGYWSYDQYNYETHSDFSPCGGYPLVGVTRYNGGWYKVVVDP